MALGSVTEESIEPPFDGPRKLVHTADETCWAVTPARAEAELDAHRRLAGHPVACARVTRRDDVLVFPRSVAARVDESLLDVLVPREVVLASHDVSPRAFFEALGGPVDAARALSRLGLSRSRVDRFLGRSVSIRSPRGIDLGGVMPSAIRRSADGSFALSVRYGRVEGWPVLDLASLALRGGLDGAALHRDLGGTDEAFELAVLHQTLRELVAERDEEARARLGEIGRAIVERFVPAEPARVLLRVEAPSFLPPSLFAPVGEVDAAHARRLLRDWDGLSVGGARVRVETTPRLARPPRVFPFEPMRARRMRLFSRFAQGIAFDDEGLYSATPEALADRIASGLSGVVVDATCGIGAITLALARARRVTRVIAIDRDPARVRMAERNAEIYGVRDRIDFRVGDAIELTRTLSFDALVVDPPWGGRDYDRARVTLDALGMPVAALLALGRPSVLKLPRSFDVTTLPEGFATEALIDERGVLKMLVARRGVASLAGA